MFVQCHWRKWGRLTTSLTSVPCPTRQEHQRAVYQLHLTSTRRRFSIRRGSMLTDPYTCLSKERLCGPCRSARTKKADVVERQLAFDHVGLLINGPPCRMVALYLVTRRLLESVPKENRYSPHPSIWLRGRRGNRELALFRGILYNRGHILAFALICSLERPVSVFRI